MEDVACDVQGARVLVCGTDGPRLSTEGDASMFISAAWAQRATMVAIPQQRLVDDFFRLSTRLAGEVPQKFVNYHLRVVIVGDISAWTAESNALRDFVYESNRGRTVWFVADLDELAQRMA